MVRATHTYEWLLWHSSLYNAGVQLTAATTVLPYIATELGAPALLVSLFVPFFTAGAVLGNIAAPKALRIGGPVVVVLTVLAVIQAGLISANVAHIAYLPDDGVVYALLITTAVIGVAAGVFTVLLPVAASQVLSPTRRSDMLLRSAGYGAALVTVVSIFSSGFLSDASPGLDDAELLLVGSVAMGLSALCLLGLRAMHITMPTQVSDIRDTLRRGVDYTRTHSWFQRYLVTNIVFRAMAFGSMFFAIYSAESLGADNGELDTILIFMGLGLLLGVPLWQRVRTHLDARGMYLCSAAVGGVAAASCLVLHGLHVVPLVWLIGGAILLVAVANQGVYPASQDWIFDRADGDARVVVFGFSQLVMNLASMPLGFVVAVLAANGPAIWPIAVMLGIALLAGASATGVPKTGRRVTATEA
ncbi:hypothetical protein JRC04_03430 [Mycolicibacterium sp. S2-37]|uniref:MFS transporter n=1 Tax=Mycolicibacterium sp. S2-37 TaxID=2810297 RepID=UPI001A945ABF|nr:MFS transporter [Mycolicibacterium sp. S2-37]MBO0676511.1 hypothetical protein [Mycolicibacterium sp. S2-37]